jgi:hypothetical protein
VHVDELSDQRSRSTHAPVYGATALAAYLRLIRFIKPPALMISRIAGGYGLI